MNTFAESVIANAPAIRGMLNFDERIRLDFRDTDASTTIGFMRCLIERGVNTSSAIQRYMDERHTQFDRKTIDGWLEQFDGNDTARHLWTHHSAHGYVALTSNGPALWSSDYGYDTE